MQDDTIVHTQLSTGPDAIESCPVGERVDDASLYIQTPTLRQQLQVRRRNWRFCVLMTGDGVR